MHCNTLRCGLGHCVNIECHVATSEQATMDDQLHQVGREESMSVEGTNMHLDRC